MRQQPTQPEVRLRLPREGEILGRVEALHGGKHLTVKCMDGKTRLCRIPGRLKRIWVREDDFVLVKPWEIQGDKRGDIVWRYVKIELEALKRRVNIPRDF